MIGLLPGIGTTLADLDRSGQLHRCLLEWRAYARAFGGAKWFGYGPETAVFTVSGADSASRINDCPPPGCPWLEVVPKSRWVGALRACRALRVLNLTGVVPALMARDVFGLPYVLQVGYDAPAVARAHGKRLRAWLLRHLQDLAVQRAAGVVYASMALWEADYRRGLHRPMSETHFPPYAVIPNGVDLEHFRPLWRCPPGKRRVVYVGRLSREKNLPLLAAACQQVGATLHLFGAGPLAAELAALPGVSCYGPVPHYALPTILADFDAFCLPSKTEGSPKALLEAMACRVPCLVSHAVAEALDLGPWEALATAPLVYCRMGAGLADGLEALLAGDGRAQAFAAAGRARVEARHDLKKTLADEIAFVHNAVGNHGQQAQQA